MKGWLDKYSEEIPQAQKGKIITVDSKNDPGYKAYQDRGDISIAQNGDYLEKLKKNNPKLYKEVQRNNRRIESTNKWNEHFEEEKKKEKAKEWVQKNMQDVYKHPLMSPGYFTPEGALIGAIQGAANVGPDLYNGEYTKAGMDALMMLPLAPNAIRTAAPVVQRMGKLMKNIGKADNILPAPPTELHIPTSGEYMGDLYGKPITNGPSPIVENLRRAYHNSERFLTLDESALLSREGYGNRLDYAPQRIQNVFNLDNPSADKMKMVTQYLDKPQLQYNDITDLPLSKLTQLNELNAGVRSRYIANGQIEPELYNEQILRNIDDTFRSYNRLNPDARLNPRITPRQLEILNVRPNTIDLRRTTQSRPYYEPEIPRNMSGYTKEQTIAMLPEDKADKIAKLSSDEFDNIYVTPKGDIVPLATTYNKPAIQDIHNDEWVESFNSNLPRLNKIIEANNTSGKPYTISSIDKSGNIKFDSEFGSSYFNTNITPGRFSGEIEDIANYQYMRDIPGISMANTSSGVFGAGGVHKGTKAYESINTYLKEMGLGRVKAGFNSQTQYSRPLWENAVKADKAVGYYGRPGTVHAVMKTVVPGAIGLGAAEQVIDQKQDGGIIDDDNGQWAHPGEVTRINSNVITMQGVSYPVLGVSDSGDTQMMYPEKNYKFKGKKVTEYPMAQDGREVLYNSKYNDKSALDKQKTWLSNWMSHPEYSKRLSKNLKESNKVTGKFDASDFFDHNFRGDDYYTNEAKELADNSKLKMLRTKVFSPSKESNEYDLIDKYTKNMGDFSKSVVAVDYGLSAGMYRPSTGDLLMKKNRAKSTGTHELTHATGLDRLMANITPTGGKLLREDEGLKKKYNTRDVRWYNDDYVFGKQNSMLPDFLESRQVRIKPDDLNISPSTRSYLNKSDEVYPRIMQMRYTNDIKPGQIINKAIFNKMKEKSGDDDIFEVYDDDQIIEMLNKFASVDNPDKNTFIAKNGKELKKLDQLTNFTNYNTPQPGGWLNKYES